MSTRHLIAAAALLAATCGAHADVISTNAVSGLTADMSIVEGNGNLGGDLATMLAASNSNAQLYLVRGVEGLYMLASRTTFVIPGAEPTEITAPALADVPADVTLPADISLPPVTDINLPVLEANEVPEPASLALMLAGVLGAAGFTRARKQG